MRTAKVCYAKIQVFSGRTHQIRCHAEYIKHPILGDKLYGKSDEEFLQIMKNEKPPVFPPFGIINRHQLHASILEFEHPVLKQKFAFESDSKKIFL